MSRKLNRSCLIFMFSMMAWQKGGRENQLGRVAGRYPSPPTSLSSLFRSSLPISLPGPLFLRPSLPYFPSARPTHLDHQIRLPRALLRLGRCPDPAHDAPHPRLSLSVAGEVSSFGCDAREGLFDNVKPVLDGRLLDVAQKDLTRATSGSNKVQVNGGSKSRA